MNPRSQTHDSFFLPRYSVHKPGIELGLSGILQLHTHVSDSNAMTNVKNYLLRKLNHTSRIHEWFLNTQDFQQSRKKYRCDAEVLKVVVYSDTI